MGRGGEALAELADQPAQLNHLTGVAVRLARSCTGRCQSTDARVAVNQGDVSS